MLVTDTLDDAIQSAVGEDKGFVLLHHAVRVDGTADRIRPDSGHNVSEPEVKEVRY
jgi:hypothetical protein